MATIVAKVMNVSRLARGLVIPAASKPDGRQAQLAGPPPPAKHVKFQQIDRPIL